MKDERTTAYLLNELSAREAQEFEEQCFAQPEWPEADLETAEEDLIQAYIKQELSPERQRRFKKYYLTTAARKERVLLARSFLRLACSGAPSPQVLTWKQRIENFFIPQPGSSWVPRFAGVLLAAALVVTLMLLAPWRSGPKTFADINLVTSSDTRAPGDTSSQVKKKVSLPLGKDALRIALTLTEPAPEGTTYRVQWEDINGPLEDLKIDKQDANTITVIIPADKLKPGQQQLRLYRKNPDGTEHRVTGDYRFDVE